jgi:hypothetical protein
VFCYSGFQESFTTLLDQRFFLEQNDELMNV